MGLARVQYGVQHADRVRGRRRRAACGDAVPIGEIQRGRAVLKMGAPEAPPLLPEAIRIDSLFFLLIVFIYQLNSENIPRAGKAVSSKNG